MARTQLAAGLDGLVAQLQQLDVAGRYAAPLPIAERVLALREAWMPPATGQGSLVPPSADAAPCLFDEEFLDAATPN
jgi:hypothetical protein